MPGPEVAVIALRPANEAPTTAPMPAISSSAWSTVPPYFQSSRPRNCMISVDGVIGYPLKNEQPAKMAAAAHMSLPSVKSGGLRHARPSSASDVSSGESQNRRWANVLVTSSTSGAFRANRFARPARSAAAGRLSHWATSPSTTVFFAFSEPPYTRAISPIGTAIAWRGTTPASGSSSDGPAAAS
jgi:hypothetical protein